MVMLIAMGIREGCLRMMGEEEGKVVDIEVDGVRLGMGDGVEEEVERLIGEQAGEGPEDSRKMFRC